MSRFQVQDDVLKRALDFLGLRGLVPHEYENTVIPSIEVARLGQPQLCRAASNIPLGNAVFTVPRGESWRIIMMSGQINQTGGTVVSRCFLEWIDANTGRFFNLPIFSRGDTKPETLTFSNTLNQQEEWTFFPRMELIVGEAWEFRQVGISGDGTRTISNAFVLYQRLGENLVSQV